MSAPEPPVDYEALGFSREEEKLLANAWNQDAYGRAGAAIHYIGTNLAITALLMYGVAYGSWLIAAIALGWIAFNTISGAIQAWRSAPVWGSAMRKTETLFQELVERRRTD